MSGRKPLGPRLVEQLDGSEQAKLRLTVILQTMTGQLTIDEASARLGIRPAQLHNLRRRVLEAGLADLEPRPRGRRPQPVDRREEQLQQQAQRINQLEQALDIAEVRRQLEVLAHPDADDELKKTTPHGRQARLQKQRRQEQKKRHRQRPPK